MPLFKKGNPGYWLGKKRLHMTDEKHWAWKGKKVSYAGLHMWVTRNLGKPTTCERCKKSGFKSKQIHWANKDHKYRRVLTDWIRLCAKCHWDVEREKRAITRNANKAKQII